MGWKDRAVLEETPPAPTTGGWRSRAVPEEILRQDWGDARSGREVAETPAQRPRSVAGRPHRPGATETFVQGASNALGTGDTMGAVLQMALSEATNLPALLTGKKPLQDVQSEKFRVFRDARKDNLGRTKAGWEDHPGASFLGRVVPGAMLGPVTGAATTARGMLATNALLGGADGASSSTADTAGGVAKDALIGAGASSLLGAVGQYLGKGLGSVATKGLERLRGRAAQGMDAAAELAEGIATRDVRKTVDSLRGEAGGAASRVGNTISNIEEIAVDGVPRTAAYQRSSLQQQIAALTEDIGDARAKAIASGLNPDEAGVGRMGEFLSKGSKLDKAQQAARKLATYEAAKQTLQDRLDALVGLADDAIAPSDAAALAAQQAAIRTSPRFADVKENVLKNALGAFDANADDAIAKRTVYQEALERQPAEIAERAASILSGDAAGARLRQLALRYGLPFAGSLIGGAADGGSGAAIGTGLGLLAGNGIEGAIGATAGAGLRPGLQALYRTATTYPAVQHGFWRGADRFASGGINATPMLPAAGSAGGRALNEALLELLEAPPPDEPQALIEALRKRGK